MANLIGGLLAVLMVTTFLGSYAIGIRSIPFAIVVLAVLPLIFFDFIQTVWGNKEKNQTGK